MKSAQTVAASSREAPEPGFIRLELARSQGRWIATLTFTGLAVIGVFATVTFRIPYPVIVFAGLLMLTAPSAREPIRQAMDTTGAGLLGAGFAILLALTAFDQPWLYLPLQCTALTGLLVLSRITSARAAFILAALVLSYAEPAYLSDPQAAIGAALLNALALAGTAWVVAAAKTSLVPPAFHEAAPAPSRSELRELVAFAMLAFAAIGIQMLFYDTISVPEIRAGVITVLLTADPDLETVWKRMPPRALCAASCAALALLMIAVGAPLMDDLGLFAVIAGCCYFAAGWVAHGGTRVASAALPGAVTVTLVLLPGVRFTTSIVPSLLNVAGVLWGLLVTALIALLLAQRWERPGGRLFPQRS